MIKDSRFVFQLIWLFVENTVDPTYLELGYLEPPLISNKSSGPDEFYLYKSYIIILYSNIVLLSKTWLWLQFGFILFTTNCIFTDILQWLMVQFKLYNRSCRIRIIFTHLIWLFKNYAVNLQTILNGHIGNTVIPPLYIIAWVANFTVDPTKKTEQSHCVV